MEKVILVAGATGNLGERIVNALIKKNAKVRILVRPETNSEKLKKFNKSDIEIYKLESWSETEVAKACAGVSCVVSALSGLRNVIIDAQKILLDAAIAAKVPRFIPSDYSLDFTEFLNGENRNLDLRREFHEYLDKTPISATTVFNGAFAELLLDEMPLILFKQKRILYWGNADHCLAFTTIDNTAEFTANVAIDHATPRYLRIAGDLITARQIKDVVSQITATKYSLFRPGGLGLLGILIKIARTISPGKNELYPAWQGMQYMRNMMDKRAALNSTDNDRYADMKWTTINDLLTKHNKSFDRL